MLKEYWFYFDDAVRLWRLHTNDGDVREFVSFNEMEEAVRQLRRRGYRTA